MTHSINGMVQKYVKFFLAVAVTIFVIHLIPINSYAEAPDQNETAEYSAEELEPVELVNLSLERVNNNDLNGARVLLELCIKYYPEYIPGYVNLSLVYDLSGDSEYALSILITAIRLYPDEPLFYYNLGNLLFKMNRLEEACENYEKTLELSPEYTPALLNMGNTLIALERYPDAVEAFLSIDAAVLEANRRALLMNSIAVAYARQGNFDQSAEYYSMGLAIQPYNINIRLNAANMCIENNVLHDFALNILIEGLELFIDNYDLYFALGEVYLLLNDYLNAIDNFLIAVSLDSSSSKAFFNIGLCYYYQQEYDTALDYYETALAVSDYTDYMAYNNAGIVYVQLGDLQTGWECYLNSLSIKPDYYLAHYNLGLLYVKLEMFVSAKEHFLLALQYNEDFDKALININIIDNNMPIEDMFH